MSHPRKPRNSHADALTETEWCFLFGARDAPGVVSAEWWSLEFGDPLFRPGRPSVAELWRDHGPDVIRAWTDKRPGTRPAMWWSHSAPGERRRLGGIGTSLGDPPRLHCGIPAEWLSARSADMWRRCGHDCPWPAVDPADPPRFEAQATFLDRHGLLKADERRRLPQNAFDPEAVVIAD